MPGSERAKQFVPFQAVKGLEEALAAKEKIRVPRRQLSEDMIAEINKKLTEIKRAFKPQHRKHCKLFCRQTPHRICESDCSDIIFKL